MSKRYVVDDLSENGSDDTSCALSEVSCDDAAPRFYSRVSTTVSKNILENVQQSVSARTVLAEVPESDPRSNGNMNGNNIQDQGQGRMQVLTTKAIVVTSVVENSDIPKGVLQDNVPKGGMLDTSSSNTVSNMLLSAKQKKVENANDSDDDWG